MSTWQPCPRLRNVDDPARIEQADRTVVVVECSEAEAELLADRLLTLGASAVSEMQVTEDRERLELTADIPTVTLADLEAFGVVLLDEALDVSHTPPALGSGPTFQVVHPGTEWKTAWESDAKVWTAGPFVVRPSWIEAANPGDRIELIVDSGEVFGSGSHPTTRLCLELLSEYVGRGDTALDVGSGSGILAVAALKSGAAAALGIDIHAEAREVSRAVAEANGVGGMFSSQTAEISDVTQTFDLVLANLLIPIVEEIGGDLRHAMNENAVVIVSGLLSEHRDRAIAALAPLTVVSEREEEGWIALVLAAS